MTPTPGRAVRGSTSGRPVMALLDLLGRRWCLRVLWELREAPLSFQALQSRCDEVSPSVLNTRLAELREARLVAAGSDGYGLTAQGQALGRQLLRLSSWAEAWAAENGGPAETAPPARRQNGRGQRPRDTPAG